MPSETQVGCARPARALAQRQVVLGRAAFVAVSLDRHLSTSGTASAASALAWSTALRRRRSSSPLSKLEEHRLQRRVPVQVVERRRARSCPPGTGSGGIGSGLGDRLGRRRRARGRLGRGAGGGGGVGRATGGCLLAAAPASVSDQEARLDHGGRRAARANLHGVSPSVTASSGTSPACNCCRPGVICRRPLPSRPIVKICVLPARVDVNARCRPLGANAGLSLVPSPNVICRTCAASPARRS